YRTVFENTDNATMVIEENCIISLANNEFAHLSGFSKDEIDGKMKWTEFVTSGDRERMLAQHRLRRESPEKALTHYEFRFVTKSGDIRTISATIDIIPGTKMSIASLHDITDRKKREEALNLEKQRIESLLSLSRMDTRTDAEITAQVVEDAIRLTGSTIGYLATLNDDESVMTMQYWSRSAHESCNIVHKPLVYAVEKTGLWGEAVRQRKPIVTNNYAAERQFRRGTPEGHVPLVRHMNIPVLDGNHIVAVAGVGNKDTDYNEGDIHELQLLMQGWWQILVRKRAEEDIRRSNVILKTQQETSPEGILTVDEQRKILNYNQTFVTIWGIPVDLLTSGKNEPVLRHIAGQVANPDTFITRVSSLYDQKEKKSSGDLLLKDGRILEWFSAPMLGEKEEYFGRVWFFRDITRRKMDEDAIRAAEEKFSTVYRQSPDIIWISELESGRFIDVNDAAERIFGYTWEECIGRNSLDLGIWVNPDDRAVLIQEIRKEGRVERSGTILRRKNGEIFHAECSASTIHIRGTEYLIITIRDISGIKRVEADLIESEARIHTLVQTIPDLIWLKDINGVYLSCNTMFERFFGAKEADIVGKTDYDFVDRELAEFFLEQDRKAIEAKKPTSNEEWITFADDGHRALLDTIKTPMFDAFGTLIGILGIGRDITKRKQAENELKISEERYRLLLQNVNDGVIVHAISQDGPGQILEVNDHLCQILGYTREELLRMSIPDLDALEPQEKIHGILDDVFSKKHAIFETEFFRNDRYRIPVEISVCLFELQGKPTVLAIVRDITERKHAEEALKESEQKFREIFNNINDAIELHEVRDDGLPGKYLEINDVSCQMLGYTREELLQHSPLDFATEYHNRPIEEIGRELLTTGRSRFETGHRNRNGRVIPVEINAHLIVLHGKTMVLAVVRDITERKMAEESLRESEEKYRLIADNTADNIWIFDMDFRLRYISPSVEKMRGFTVEEAMALPLDRHMTPDSLAAVRCQFEKEMEREASGTEDPHRRVSFETEEYCRDGSTIFVDNSVTLLRDAAGRPTGILGISRDITERKHAEEALRESEYRFRELFNTMSSGVAVYRAVDNGADFVFVDFNPGAETIDKTRKQDVIGRPVSQVFPGVTEFGIMDVFRRVWRTGEPEHHPLSIYKDDRITGWRENYIYRLPSGEIVAIYDDVTERRLAEETVRKSFAILKGVVESPKDVVIFALDRQYRYMAFNENHRRTMNQIWGADIILGTSMLDYIRLPEDREKAVLNFNRALAGESFSVIEAYGDTALERRWYEDTYNPVTDENGNVIGLTLFLTDITERKRAEEALRESEQKFREIFNKSNDAIELREMRDDGLPGKYLEVNDIACRMLGYTREELLQHSPSDFTLAYPSRPVEEIGRDLLTTGYSRFEIGYRNRDGGVIPVEINAHAIVLYGKMMVLSVVRDITERKKAEESLQKAHDELEIRVQEQTAALRESEERLRLKLDSILMPDADISELELINILDIPAIQYLMEDFSRLTGMVTAIVDL
ncbi:MAG: PAS domain S-box protein, partial [Methanoregula sp.]|nr:PAS domain S-box protein [Methanoregula sp.]